jgi:hypothetical protein
MASFPFDFDETILLEIKFLIGVGELYFPVPEQ